ncbi:MAG TPA: hypothetical protein DCL77_15255 [Prolixibacteraceae bacterium]|jgi:PAS domain S-box-containing protein|nr:hypothetical protein [Prolixibacteraceae bacterium]
MEESIILELVQNVAILLTFSMLYDYLWSRNENRKKVLFKIGSGMVLGAVGIVLVLTPWHFVQGIFFDTRSILLSIAGLFFGLIPTIIAMTIIGLYRLYLGGSGVWMGITVIVTSGVIGLLWGYLRPFWKKKKPLLEMAAMGIVVHLVMLCCTFLLPAEIKVETLKNIILPVIFIYPIATVLLGALMLKQAKNWENRKALKFSEKRFRTIIEQATDALFILDLDGKILDVNQQASKNLGYTREELLTLKITDFDIMYNEDQIKETFRNLAFNGSITSESEHRKKNGSIFPVDIKSSIINLDGLPRVIGIVRDITERKKAEQELSRERMMLRTLIDNLPATIYVKDAQCRKIIANKADLDIVGLKSEEVIGKTDLETFNNEVGQRGFADDMIVIKTRVPVLNREEDFIDSNGIKRWLLTSKIPLTDENGNVLGLVGIGRDITTQKRDQEQILKLSKGIEQNPSSIEITDINGIIEYVNPRLCETTGYTSEEIIGKHTRFLKSNEMSEEIYSDLWKTIGSGSVWKKELINKKKDGSLFWELVTLTSIKNDKGLITNYIAIKEDITARKEMEAELINAKEKAEESDRLKSAFLANMSHEIRTPLNSIIGFSELLADPDFDHVQKDEFIKTIIDNGNSLLVIISDIMDFSMLEARQMIIRKEIISTKALLNELLSDFGKKAKQRGLELRLDKSSDDRDIIIENDSYRIKQVFNNLIGNALKFTHEGYIEVGYQLKDEMIEFHVKDTGIGIAPEYHLAIFDRFRQVDTAKTRKYGGNGLGLAISKNLVELLGGNIWVTSEPDNYSNFYFTIPIKTQNSL